MQTDTRCLIGLASGSSGDGMDAALLEASGVGLDLKPRLRHHHHEPYSKDLRELLLKINSGQPVPIRQLSLAHRVLGEAFASAARRLAERDGLGLQQVQCVGLGGHHAWHEPDGRFPSTLGLGMAALVAERTGLTVVSDFRGRDVAVGGQGASLTAIIDYLLFRDLREARVLIHLGGLASVVYLPPEPRPRQILGFHAGPCNVLLDAMMRRLTGGKETFDAGGKHSVQGCCIEHLLNRWLEHPAIQRRPPRTISMQIFGEDFAAQMVEQAAQSQTRLHDLLCTATHFVARCVGNALTRFLPTRPGRVLISGGGVRNGFLLKLLEHYLPGLPLEKTDLYGIPAGARKAVAFAGLAALTLDGVPANLTTATGASGSRLLGSLTPGSPANWARCLAWMDSAVASPLAA